MKSVFAQDDTRIKIQKHKNKKIDDYAIHN